MEAPKLIKSFLSVACMRSIASSVAYKQATLRVNPSLLIKSKAFYGSTQAFY
jgi:hypothetical protein